MEKQQSRYSRSRKILLILFLLSTLVFSLLCLYYLILPLDNQGPGDPGTDVCGIGVLIATATSCLTSVTTFTGFISTTILAWRKEKRETRKMELESRRQEIEIEKTKLELENLKKARESKKRGKRAA